MELDFEKLKVATEFKQRRFIFGMTQVQFAKRLGITQNYLTQIERGHKLPSMKLLFKLEKMDKEGELGDTIKAYNSTIEDKHDYYISILLRKRTGNLKSDFLFSKNSENNLEEIKKDLVMNVEGLINIVAEDIIKSKTESK